MMRWMLMAAALAAWQAQAAEYNQVLAEKSSISFAFKQMGVSADGRFRRHSAQIAFDPAKPEAARTQIDIDLASIDTGSAEGDEEVRRKPWLNLAEFPKARFVSTAVKPVGGNRYEVSGKLTIKATTRDVTIPATFMATPGGGQLEGGFVIKRLDYKIGEGVWSDLETVANEVQVKFRLAIAAGAATK